MRVAMRVTVQKWRSLIRRGCGIRRIELETRCAAYSEDQVECDTQDQKKHASCIYGNLDNLPLTGYVKFVTDLFDGIDIRMWGCIKGYFRYQKDEFAC